jgi:hypothetical protein
MAAVILTFAATGAIPAAASTVKSVIVYKACRSQYVAENSMGYVFLEWYGGSDPEPGDVIIGELNSYGFKDVYNLGKDQEMRVWIDDYMLSKQRVIDKINSKCK